MIWNVVRSYRLSDADASDAHAMTWVRLVDHVGSIREPDRIAGWLRRTASNEALAIIRRSRRVESHDPDDFDRRTGNTSAVDARLLVDEDVRRVRRTFRTLDAQCQQLLRLLYGDTTFSYDEIAEIMGRPIGSIGPTRQRCLEKMRTKLASTDGEAEHHGR